MLEAVPPANDSPLCVAAFYKFVALADPRATCEELEQLCAAAPAMVGTILVAPEGINATIAAPPDAMTRFLAAIRNDPRFADIAPKYSRADAPPFRRMKVRLKKEIVTMGVADCDPQKLSGDYVTPQDWNALIAEDGVMVIDTRNDYEVALGSFVGAVNPELESFGDFPRWVADNLESLPVAARPKKIAMFCTGGIRCEKSTSYLRALGYENVFHLEGGILKYLENVAPQDSTWQGACFVFDGRVALEHGLAAGDYQLCHACRMPLDAAARAHAAYEAGVSCPHCIDQHNEADRARFRERQKQITLTRKRG